MNPLTHASNSISSTISESRNRGRAYRGVSARATPGSQVVADYLDKSGLQKDLDALGFNLVGFGCTTCIGNSGPLPEEISEAINKNDLVAASVLFYEKGKLLHEVPFKVEDGKFGDKTVRLTLVVDPAVLTSARGE